MHVRERQLLLTGKNTLAASARFRAAKRCCLEPALPTPRPISRERRRIERIKANLRILAGLVERDERYSRRMGPTHGEHPFFLLHAGAAVAAPGPAAAVGEIHAARSGAHSVAGSNPESAYSGAPQWPHQARPPPSARSDAARSGAHSVAGSNPESAYSAVRFTCL